MLGLLLAMAGCSQFSPGVGGSLTGLLSAESETAGTGATSRLTEAAATLEPGLAAARSLEQQGASEEAIEAYIEIARNHGATVEVQRRLAVLYDKTTQFDQSARHYLAALQIEPNDADLLCDYGYSRYLQGDLAVAEQVLRRALAADPDLVRAHNNLGLVLARGEKHDEALAAFTRAGCSPAEARANLAYALISGGDWQSAQEHLESAEAAN